MTTAKLILLTVALIFTGVGSLFIGPSWAYARQSSDAAHLSSSPTIESVSDRLAFIRWTAPNPGGTTLHYAVIRFGKDPNHLDFTAKSPTRINPGHSEMVFRVRIQDLEPGTTYYYKVSSEQANGIPDPETSRVNQFTTRTSDWMSAKK
jgi:hypothetical protein